MNKLLEQMVAELKKNKYEDVIPSGFFTIKQIAKHMERSEWTTRRYIDKAILNKKMDRIFFKSKNKIGRIITVPYYKLRN